jgi:4-aminobutyrate aminotransferase/(S)-3-amino-2-methylpropionate transaminase
MALEFVKDRATKEPAKELVQRITQLCYERGLIAISAGTYGNVIRTLMPLVITEEQLEEGLDILEGAILDASQELMPAPVPAAGSVLPGPVPVASGPAAG